MGQSRTPSIAYEIPRVLVASEVLPPELSIGKNFSVSGELATPEDTITQGFTYRFKIVSSVGNFEAHCIDMLRIRIQEIKAIGILLEIKKNIAFDNTLEKVGKSPYSGVMELILHPVDTITGIPEGGWRFITRSGEMVKGGPEGKEDRSGDVLVDFSKLKRRYAYKLGVDVYSSNKVLQKELNSVSWAGFASGEGTSLLLSKHITGTAGMIIVRTPFLDKTERILLDNAPDELLLINQEKLKQIGVKEPVIKEFLSHPNYSPRHKTIVVHALAEMDGTQNRNKFIKQAILVEHEEMAFIYQRTAEMMHSYHKNVKSIVEIIPFRKSVAGYTSDQAIVSTLPLDYVYWTELTDLFVSELLLLLESEDRPVKRVNMWISGKFTPTAKKALAAKGITLKENM
jgi:hypothetical protein